MYYNKQRSYKLNFVQAFSENNLRTVITKRGEDQGKLGQRNSLSKYDIKLANMMYNCPSGKLINCYSLGVG